MKNVKQKRSTKTERYMELAKAVSIGCTCFRIRIGAIIVGKDDQVVATGYVGAPRKTKDCFDHGFCLRNKLRIPAGHRYELCRSVHAEMNCIINAARAGVSTIGGDIYLYGHREPSKELMDMAPCFFCKRIIINAGLKRVICFTKNGGVKIFKVADWVKEWQKKDIIEDHIQYGK